MSDDPHSGIYLEIDGVQYDLIPEASPVVCVDAFRSLMDRVERDASKEPKWFWLGRPNGTAIRYALARGRMEERRE